MLVRDLNNPIKAILKVLSIALIFLVSSFSLYEISITLFTIRWNSEARNALYPLMNGLFNTASVLCLFLLFKKFNLYHISLSLLLGFFLSYYEAIDYLHNFLLHYHLHPLLTVFQNLANPQITKVFISSIFYLIFLCFMLRKKNRNFDRKFFFIIITAIFVTTFLFHRMSAHLLFQQDKNLVTGMITALIENHPSNEQLGSLGIYTFKKPIGSLVSNDLTSVDGIGEFPSPAWNLLPDIEKFVIHNPNRIYQQIFFNNGNKNGNFLIIGQIKDEQLYLYIVEDQINQLLSRDEVWFFLLCIMAHTIWIFGGIVLWSYHKYRFKKRITENN